MGMLLAILGAAVIVMFSRAEEPQLSPEAIVEALTQPHFLIYSGFVCSALTILLILDKTKLRHSHKTYGDQTMIIRVMLTALFSKWIKSLKFSKN
jgi:hypothetical protein